MGSASSTEQQPPVASPPVSRDDKPKEDETTSGCPMHKADGSYSWDPRAMWRTGFPHGPGGSKPLDTTDAATLGGDKTVNESGSEPSSSSGGGCPVKASNRTQYNVYAQPLNPNNNMPSQPNQLPAASQTEPLSTERIASTIPKGGSDTATWTYPSPQMFFNALERKHKLDGTSEQDMESVVAVHNQMNEVTWKQVVEWERVIRGDAAVDETPTMPKLLKFQGRPHDLSPKATLKHYLLGHTLPFDRHDWYIERPDGSVVRYVLDYYASEDAEQLHVDVRPAMDNPMALWARTFTMPSAQAAQSTSYETLPLQPMPSLRTTASAVPSSSPLEPTASPDSKQNETTRPSITLCRAEQTAVDMCQTGDDDERRIQRASMDLTLCLGRHLCPLQMAAMAKADDADMEAAFVRLQECVTQKTASPR